MSGHSHDDHSSTEQKPVSFTVPFFLAVAVILGVVMFLSLCDPKAHHAGAEAHGHEGAAKEASHHNAAAAEHHEAAAANTVEKDTLPVETTIPNADPAHH